MIALSMSRMRTRLLAWVRRYRQLLPRARRATCALLLVMPIIATSSAPLSALGDEGTPTAEHCLPAGTPTANPADDDRAEETPEADDIVTPEPDARVSSGRRGEKDRCARGAVPTRVVIDTIGVDADVEILETVDGTMQELTTADQVAWYKETARLGETGNTVMAGYLNYWGIPEGVFFAIDTLQEGDEIVITGDRDQEFTIAVLTVNQEDASQPPSEDVPADTDASTLTLITCGGEWNADASEYDHRTVVRAQLVTGDD